MDVRVHLHVGVDVDGQVHVNVRVCVFVCVFVCMYMCMFICMYLNGPSCRVDDPVVSVLGPVHPELLEDVRDCHQHAATHDQLLPCQHILLQGDSQADSVTVQGWGCARWHYTDTSH